MKNLSRSIMLLICLSALVIIFAACAPPATPVPAATAPSNGITNINWQWTSITNQTTRETTDVPNPQDYTIIFRDDGTLSGQADCNSFSGTYSQGTDFIITLGPITMAACGEESLDTVYVQLLGAIVAGGPDGVGNLALETPGGEQRMLFANGGPASP